MKSIINSEPIKEIVLKAVEKALSQCAEQHNANIDQYNDIDHLGELDNIYMTTQPIEIQLKLKFIFGGKNHSITCLPYIDISKLK